MSFLVDTNVISEFRKLPRCHPGVAAWMANTATEDIFFSVLVTGEIRGGIERLRRRDMPGAEALERWLSRLIREHGDRILPVTAEIAETWGRLNAMATLPTVDGLLAATAAVHGLTVVTRNVRDLARTGVPVLNPFEAGGTGN